MRLLVLVVLVCALVAGVPTVSAHGNHVSVDDQYVENGTVVIETVFTSSDGFLVLHADDGGEPGDPIGHAAVEFGFETGLEVTVNETGWRNQSGPTTVWAVIHRDDGDGRFDPDRDEPVSSFGGEAEKRMVVAERSAGPASVVAADFDSQATNGTVLVDRVALGRDGALVVRADRNGTPGRVVGRTRLDAGVHEDVRVALDRSYYRTQDTRFGLWATVSENGSPVVVDGSPVASEFGVRKHRATATDARAGTDGATDSVTTGGPESPGTQPDATGTEGPGFGVLYEIAAVVIAVLLRSRAGE